MEPVLKRSALRSLCFSLISSVVIYAIAWTFFTIHEEVGVPARNAFPIAAWSFPVLFLVSLFYFALKDAGQRKR